MFDSAPPNLPVEPVVPPVPPSVPPPSASPSPSPATSVPESPKPMTTTPKKEPEDIFSGLEREAVRPPVPSAPESSPGGVPWKKLLIVLGAVIALIAIVMSVWIFVIGPRMKQKEISVQTAAQKMQQTQPSPSGATQVEQPPAIETPPVVVTEPPKGVTIPTPVLPPPVFVPTEGRDSDGDGLTDVEEPYYVTDSTKNDTNENGYPDGVEVRNLYNPSKNGGRKLAEAPFMSKLSWASWSFLAPKPWSIVPDAKDEKKALLVTGTATRFEIALLPNPTKETIDAWLLKQGLTAAQSFKTKAGLDARQTADGLTTYLSSDDKVLRMTYDLNGDTTFEFRASYFLLLHSLMPQSS